MRLRGIHKALGGSAVLEDVNLEVASGRTVALLGPNGSGKSTLLRIAGGISRPDRGRVEIHGIDARAQPELARRHASLLLQQAPLYAELTPREHLSWWSRVRGLGLAASQIDAAAAECGLTRQAHRPAATLSRGQQQRLALAMVLLPNPPLLLLDEPFTALDEEAAAWLQARLQARRGHGATLLSLHSTEHAARLADQVHRLSRGALA